MPSFGYQRYRCGGQEQPVGDLAVGQAVSGNDGDLALLCGEPVQGARSGVSPLRRVDTRR
jgi:hypothetical protein